MNFRRSSRRILVHVRMSKMLSLGVLHSNCCARIDGENVSDVKQGSDRKKDAETNQEYGREDS